MAGDITVKVNEGVDKCGKGCNLFIQLILLIIWTALAITMIVLGSINLNLCLTQPYIPIYLIVAGVFILSFWVFLPLEFFFPTIRKILSALVCLFLFAWLIAGSVWVFSIYNTARICTANMYLFAFWILIIQYIFLGLGIIFCIISCFCASFCTGLCSRFCSSCCLISCSSCCPSSCSSCCSNIGCCCPTKG